MIKSFIILLVIVNISFQDNAAFKWDMNCNCDETAGSGKFCLKWNCD
jgi:hypothetical protein